MTVKNMKETDLMEGYCWENGETPTFGEFKKRIIQDYEKEKKNINFRKPKLFNNSQVEKIKELKKQGLSNIRIAKVMGCSEGTIRNYLKATQTP